MQSIFSSWRRNFSHPLGLLMSTSFLAVIVFTLTRTSNIVWKQKIETYTILTANVRRKETVEMFMYFVQNILLILFCSHSIHLIRKFSNDFDHWLEWNEYHSASHHTSLDKRHSWKINDNLDAGTNQALYKIHVHMKCDLTTRSERAQIFPRLHCTLSSTINIPRMMANEQYFRLVSHWLIFIVFFPIDSGPKSAQFHHFDAHNHLSSLFPILSTRFRSLLFANWLDQLFNSQLKLKHTPTSLFLCTSFRDECGEKKTFNSIIIIRPKRYHRTDTRTRAPHWYSCGYYSIVYLQLQFLFRLSSRSTIPLAGVDVKFLHRISQCRK